MTRAAGWLVLLCVAACSRGETGSTPTGAVTPEPATSQALGPRLSELVARCEAAIRERPDDARAHGTLGLAYEANGRFREAVPHYERAAALDPNEPLFGLHAALCETECGELDGALRRLEDLARRHPRCAPLLQRLGLARWESGDFERAAESYRALAALPDGAAAGFTGLAECELALGRPERALEACDAALAADPAYGLPRFLRARALEDLDRHEEAARERAQVPPTARRMLGDEWGARAAEFAASYEARFAAATRLFDGGRTAEGRAALEALARERPDDVRVLGNLAMARAASGELEAALEVCESALARAPDSAPLHVARALVLLGAGRAAEARASARRACELAPTSERARRVLERATIAAEGRAVERSEGGRR